MGRGTADGAAAVPGLPSWLQPGSLLRRVAHRLFPYALGCSVTVFSLIAPMKPAVFLFALQWADPPTALIALAMVATGAAAALVRWRRWPLFIISPAVWLALSMSVGVFVAAYYAGAGRPGRPDPGRAWPFFLVAALLVGVPVAWSAVHDDLLYEGMTGGVVTGGVITGLAWVSMAVLLPFVFGLWVRARRQVVAQLRERAERLEREQHERAEHARAEERRRIAREMHDVVAHRVALMVLHAGALEVSTADPRTAEEAALIRTTGREAMQELREVLGMLRAPDMAAGPDLAPQPTMDELDRLLDSSRAAGLPVRRVDVGEPHQVPLSAQRTAYRVVQEGLTNVAKHAGAAPTTVTLHHGPRELVVAVENAAPPLPAPPLPGSGLGLVGLAERLALAGGEVQARPRLDGGFLLYARIPADPPEPAVNREVPA
ncbi:histidine kinase [Catellatospora sp. NPDC049609]|uniref:sensor histidine kinase n=1 Tax=Catellatospora sp. NPDC049609 TaxID=3155505 RepID=UPI00341231C0